MSGKNIMELLKLIRDKRIGESIVFDSRPLRKLILNIRLQSAKNTK